MKYLTEVKVDENGEYFIEIPEELAKELDWNVDDTLNWSIEGDAIILSKKNKEEKKND